MIQKLSGKEYGALQSLMAMVSYMEALLPFLERRAKTVPGVWRDLMLIRKKCATCMDSLLVTIPPEKLQHIRADIEHTKIYVMVEAPGLSSKKMSDNFAYLPVRTLNQLLGYVCEHECMMCDKTPTQARKCHVRKKIDDALPHEVNAQDGEHCKYSDMTIGMEVTA